VQKSFFMDACWIGEIMNTEEWPEKTKKKVLAIMGLIVVSVLVLSLFA
jgi:hypothetical protein